MLQIITQAFGLVSLSTASVFDALHRCCLEIAEGPIAVQMQGSKISAFSETPFIAAVSFSLKFRACGSKSALALSLSATDSESTRHLSAESAVVSSYSACASSSSTVAVHNTFTQSTELSVGLGVEDSLQRVLEQPQLSPSVADAATAAAAATAASVASATLNINSKHLN
eukprot:CAMPEP_0172803586 /NCGR_PEP_ID=MMETSP1075-20121228/4606_1 /TAXON_ID=2916 /ORGANISM="Ceratium fusus, Strain PA161109" /LENGTH=169 /DNA_ID=CAMNT_0013642037 /DNA_START=653 /DNA_END=1162 /DNA_ORIENTATION=-